MQTISQNKLSQIRKWYYKDKLSAREISKRLNAGIDAVYYFMRKNTLKRRNFFEENKLRFERKPLSFNIKKNLSFYEKELKAVGTILYWGEGYKTSQSNGIDLANSDPEMIKIFVNFLRKICKVDESRLRVFLYCYSNQNVDDLIKFWRNITRISEKQFTKPYVRNDFKAIKVGKMPYGLIHIRYSDKKLLAVIKEWIGQYKNKFI